MMGVCGDFVSDDENVLVLLGGLMCGRGTGGGRVKWIYRKRAPAWWWIGK